MLQHQVDRQPVQPGAEGRLAAKAPELLPRPDEHVLGQLLGVGIRDHAAHQGMHPVHVHPVQPLEGAAVPALGEGDLDRLLVALPGLLAALGQGARSTL